MSSSFLGMIVALGECILMAFFAYNGRKEYKQYNERYWKYCTGRRWYIIGSIGSGYCFAIFLSYVFERL